MESSLTSTSLLQAEMPQNPLIFGANGQAIEMNGLHDGHDSSDLQNNLDKTIYQNAGDTRPVAAEGGLELHVDAGDTWPLADVGDTRNQEQIVSVDGTDDSLQDHVDQPAPVPADLMISAGDGGGGESEQNEEEDLFGAYKEVLEPSTHELFSFQTIPLDIVSRIYSIHYIYRLDLNFKMSI